MTDVVIVAAARTAIGKFGGTLGKIPAADLGAHVIKALLAKTGLKPDQISEVILGQVLTAGVGQNPARQAAIKAGLPDMVPAMTINKVCGSGLKATHLAAQAITAGDADIVIAGGQENMSARAARAERLARRLSHGRRQAGRHHDRRRPVGRLQPVPHGRHRRERRQEVRRHARGAGRVRGWRASRRPRPRRRPGRFKDEIVPLSRFRSARAIRWCSTPTSIRSTAPPPRRSPALQARVRQERHGDRRQRLGHQRRRRRGGHDVGEEGRRSWA